MRKHLTSIALSLLATSALATPQGNGNQECNNRCGDTINNVTNNQGGQGGHASATAGAAALAASASNSTATNRTTVAVGVVNEVRNDLSNTNTVAGSKQDQGQSQGQQQQNQQQQNFSGNGSGNTTSMIFEKSAPSMNVGTQNAPIYNCRWSLGIASSSPGGGGALSGIPLWREGDCQGVQAVAVMSAAGTLFTPEDITRAACSIDRVAESKTCEKLRQADADRKHALALYGN